MKIKTLLIGASALGFASAAHAQTSVVNITGATAFRAAAHAAIVAGYTGNLTVGTTGTNSSVNGHSTVIYKGTFTGHPGTTIIRTSWSGSVEGIRALVDSKNTKLNATKFIAANATFSGNATAPTLNLVATDTLALTKGLVADLAFSDCNVLSTPYAKKGASLTGASAGIIAFAPCVNKDSNGGITNLTTQQLRELHKQGTVPLSRFTGSSGDHSTDVYNVQRYDGSGTRVIALAEGGFGAATLSKGYVFPTSNGLGNGTLTLTTTPELCPASNSTSTYTKFGVSSSVNRVSHSSDFYPTFSANHTGNGGYVSGGSIASLMISSGSKNIVSVLGSGDAKTVYNSGSNGGRIISYNGEILTGLATTGSMTTADKDKIRYGKYSLWSTQMLYSLGTPAANTAKKAVYDALTALTDAELGVNGVATTSMQVSRTLNTAKGGTIDGGLIKP